MSTRVDGQTLALTAEEKRKRKDQSVRRPRVHEKIQAFHRNIVKGIAVKGFRHRRRPPRDKPARKVSPFFHSPICACAKKSPVGTNVLLLDPQPRTYHRHQRGSEVRLWDACLSSTRSPRWSFWGDGISSSLPTTAVEEPKRYAGYNRRARARDESSTSAG